MRATHQLRGGYTTGACAAAAAKAAVSLLLMPQTRTPETVEIPLPDGERVAFAINFAEILGPGRAWAGVQKSAGDDPDVTDGALIIAEVARQSGGITFLAGDGIGTVTRSGLSVSVGAPAINPGPQKMIRRAIREISENGFAVTISVPGGRKLAAKTFNPRLGIEGGLSILGTSGRVVPYSCDALRDALKCGLDVSIAAGATAPVFVPGNIGRRAALRHLDSNADHIVEVSNEWGFMLDFAAEKGITRVLALGHPGKLAKLAMGHFNTHSRKSPTAVAFVRKRAAAVTGAPIADAVTVEGVFQSMLADEIRHSAEALARDISDAIAARTRSQTEAAVALINMKGDWLGSWGDLSVWKNG